MVRPLVHYAAVVVFLGSTLILFSFGNATAKVYPVEAGTVGNIVNIDVINSSYILPFNGATVEVISQPGFVSNLNPTSTSTTPEDIPVNSIGAASFTFNVESGVPNGTAGSIQFEISSGSAATCIKVIDLTVGTKGDVNYDDQIDIVDAVEAVAIVLGVHPPSLPPTNETIWAADCNYDESVDIIDVLCIINIILYGKSMHVGKSVESVAVVQIFQCSARGGESKDIQISIATDVPVAGGQFNLSYDAHNLVFGIPEITERSSTMNVAADAKDGKLTVVIYSTCGKSIPAGSGPIITFPFKNKNSEPGDEDALRFEDVILASSDCQSIPVEIEPIVFKTVPLPTEFALGQNYPNPFNPVTSIQYSVVSEQSPPFVTLKIFNILGQKVTTLVNEFEETGYYTVTWDGKDSFGKDAASGIYFYRLTAGDYTATKRMVLMK